jgi:hypothetical protein
MYRRLFKFAVTALTILTANLLTTFLTDWLISHRWDTKPLRFTLISMGIITIVFYENGRVAEQFLTKIYKSRSLSCR